MRGTIDIAGTKIELQPLQFNMIVLLKHAMPAAVRKSELIHAMWGDHCPADVTARFKIALWKLRKQLPQGASIVCAKPHHYMLTY